MTKLTEEIKEILIDLATKSARAGNLFNSGVVLENGNVIARSKSLVISNKDSTAHSERLLVEKVCKMKGSNRTPGLTMVTIVEPCLMCLGACSWAKYSEILYIIPARKYIKKMPWMSDSIALSKEEIGKQMDSKVKVRQIKELEDQFCEVFEREMSKHLE